ncbi:MAG: pseudomurein-binding repeat-containing protein [Methanobacterium sp.]
MGTEGTQTNNNNVIKENVSTQSENINNIYASTKTKIKVESNLSTKNSNTTLKETNGQIKPLNTESQVNTVSKNTDPVSNQSTAKTATVVNKPTQIAAAGDVTPKFTLDQIKDAASRVKTYIETNKKLPNYVTIGTNQVLMPDFLKLVTAALLQINSGNTAPIILKSVKSPVLPVESISSGNMFKADYLDLAKRVNAYIDTYGIIPNYASTPLGKIRYENLIYSFSKVLNFQKVNNYLPSYVTVKPYSSFVAPILTQARTVYLTTDYINGYTTDMNRLNTIANALKAMGLNVVNYGVGSNTHYSVLQAASIPATALVVDMYGGADAGLIYEMGSSYYKKLVSTKKVFCVWMPPAWDITGLAWLPRAHDDNYSPASFTGLANPDQYLLNNGYHYIYSADLNAIISAIYKEATT